MKEQVLFATGNEAATAGAIAAGARFYAGYPITPSSEIAEMCSRQLPQVGGMFVQMEDELGSIAAVIGASAAGKKAFTATSGPGFSLMQENLGVAVMSEIPCVVINVMRSGPSTGVATKPAQGDVMQARWGMHGDHGIIALCPGSVQECYDLIVTAFNFSERYRTPVFFLSDEVIGHMREKYVKRELSPQEIFSRKAPTCPPEQYRPYGAAGEADGIAPLAAFGSPYVFRVNSTSHDEYGDATTAPPKLDQLVRNFTEKLERNRKDICLTKSFGLADAEVAIITYGCSTRGARAAMKRLRERGVKAGILQLVTLWPFPEEAVRQVLSTVKAVVVPELNLGQMIGEVRQLNTRGIPVVGVNRVDTMTITPEQIMQRVQEVLA